MNKKHSCIPIGLVEESLRLTQYILLMKRVAGNLKALTY